MGNPTINTINIFAAAATTMGDIIRGEKRSEPSSSSGSVCR